MPVVGFSPPVLSQEGWEVIEVLMCRQNACADGKLDMMPVKALCMLYSLTCNKMHIFFHKHASHLHFYARGVFRSALSGWSATVMLIF